MQTFTEAIAALAPAEVRRRRASVTRACNRAMKGIHLTLADRRFPSLFVQWTTAEYVREFERKNHLAETV
jgi:hypothetical protein